MRVLHFVLVLASVHTFCYATDIIESKVCTLTRSRTGEAVHSFTAVTPLKNSWFTARNGRDNGRYATAGPRVKVFAPKPKAIVTPPVQGQPIRNLLRSLRDEYQTWSKRRSILPIHLSDVRNECPNYAPAESTKTTTVVVDQHGSHEVHTFSSGKEVQRSLCVFYWVNEFFDRMTDLVKVITVKVNRDDDRDASYELLSKQPLPPIRLVEEWHSVKVKPVDMTLFTGIEAFPLKFMRDGPCTMIGGVDPQTIYLPKGTNTPYLTRATDDDLKGVLKGRLPKFRDDPKLQKAFSKALNDEDVAAMNRFEMKRLWKDAVDKMDHDQLVALVKLAIPSINDPDDGHSAYWDPVAIMHEAGHVFWHRVSSGTFVYDEERNRELIVKDKYIFSRGLIEGFCDYFACAIFHGANDVDCYVADYFNKKKGVREYDHKYSNDEKRYETPLEVYQMFDYFRECETVNDEFDHRCGVHNIGEIIGAALWTFRRVLISRHVGDKTARAKEIDSKVLLAILLMYGAADRDSVDSIFPETASSAGFLVLRDCMLHAASGDDEVELLWRIFAAHGMGTNAAEPPTEGLMVEPENQFDLLVVDYDADERADEPDDESHPISDSAPLMQAQPKVDKPKKPKEFSVVTATNPEIRVSKVKMGRLPHPKDATPTQAQWAVANSKCRPPNLKPPPPKPIAFAKPAPPKRKPRSAPKKSAFKSDQGSGESQIDDPPVGQGKDNVVIQEVEI